MRMKIASLLAMLRGYFRRNQGAALKGFQRVDEALKAYGKGLSLDP
jgi:hypothetical protein